MNKFYEATMGPLPPQTCRIFAILSYLELLNIVIMVIVLLALAASGKVWLAVLSLASVIVIAIRYLTTRLLYNMCIHRQ